MSDTKLTKNFLEFRGLDAKSNDIRRRAGFSTPGTLNDNLTHDNQIEKRPGFKSVAQMGSVSLGLHAFNEFKFSENGDTLEKTPIMVRPKEPNGTPGSSLSVNKYRVGELRFNTTTSCFIRAGHDAGSGFYRVQIWEGQTDDTGTADVDVSDPSTIADLVAAIGAVSGITVTIDSDIDQSESVKVIEQIERSLPSPGSLRTAVLIEEDISLLLSNEQFRVPADSMPVSMASNRNILYFATGSDEIHRYDGRYIYPAGGPFETREAGFAVDLLPDIYEPIPTTGTGTLNGDVKVRIQMGFLDEQGNILWDNLSKAKNINLTGDSIEHQHDADMKRINFKQAELLNVFTNTLVMSNSSHGFVAGDRVVPREQYFASSIVTDVVRADLILKARVVSVSSNILTLNLSSAETSSLFGGSTGGNITNGLMARVFRTEQNGELFYQRGIYTAAENTGTADRYDIQTGLVDNASDSELVSGGQLDFFDDSFDVPPRCRYLTQFSNQLILSGPCSGVEGDIPDNLVYFTDRTNIDAVPRASNLFSTDTDDATGVKGVYGDEDHLLIFKNRKTIRVTGDLAALQFRTDVISKNIGTESHFSIQKLNDGRTTFMSHRGPYAALRGQTVVPLGGVQGPSGEMESLLATFFNKALDVRGDNQFDLSTCVAANHVDRNLNIFSFRDTDDSPVCFTYNYAEGSWHEWTNYDLKAGATDYTHTMDDGRLYTGLFFHVTPVAGTKRFYKVSDTHTEEDMHDDGAAIPFTYITHYEHLGVPSVDKKWIRCSIWSLNTYIDFDLVVEAICDWGNFSAGIIAYDINGTASPAVHNQKGKLASQKSRSMGFVMTNSTILEQVKITGYDVEYQTPYAAGMKQ